MDEERRVDFADPGAVEDWTAIDDVVMGGRSASGLRATDGESALFAGRVSLEDGGGFASVRSRPREWALAGTAGIALRVRGDGKTYKLGLRTDDERDGVTWQAAFETRAGVWQTVRIAFDTLAPRWRGRAVTTAEPLRPETVRTLGLLISDRQPGPFRLELAWIGVWR